MTPERPDVLFVIGGLGQGGSEGQLTQLVLAAHPHVLRATVVLLMDGSFPHRDRLERHGVRVLAVGRERRRNALLAALSALRLLALVVRRRPSVLYAWLEGSAVAAAPVAWCTGIPLAVARRNVIGSQLDRRHWPLSRLGPACERSARVVTVNSQAGIRFAASRGIDPARVRVVPNGHPALPPLPARTDPGGVVFGCVARFRPGKGHVRLLEALAQLGDDAAWSLRLAGDGDLLATVRRRVTELGLDGRVELLGALDDVRAFWASCDVAVLTSDSEGQPNALIEAAFAGRAAIATAVGGTPEVVAPDGGLLVDPDDPGALTAALQRFVDDPELAARLGAAAHAQASDRFSIDATVKGHLDALWVAMG